MRTSLKTSGVLAFGADTIARGCVQRWASVGLERYTSQAGTQKCDSVNHVGVRDESTPESTRFLWWEDRRRLTRIPTAVLP